MASQARQQPVYLGRYRRSEFYTARRPSVAPQVAVAAALTL